MGAWGFTVGLKLNGSVLVDSDGSQYYWYANQGLWKSQIAVLSVPDGATDFLTILKGPDRQGGFRMSLSCWGFFGFQSSILGSDGS